MKVIINRGAPGSGKTSGAQALTNGLPHDEFAVCSSDLYPGLYDADGRFHPELLSKSHPACMADCIRAMLAGVPLVIVDNTSTTAVEVAPYVLVAQSFGYEVEIWRYTCGTAAEHLRRNQHGVSHDAIVRMLNNLEQPLPPWWPAEQVIDTSK